MVRHNAKAKQFYFIFRSSIFQLITDVYRYAMINENIFTVLCAERKEVDFIIPFIGKVFKVETLSPWITLFHAESDRSSFKNMIY